MFHLWAAGNAAFLILTYAGPFFNGFWESEAINRDIHPAYQGIYLNGCRQLYQIPSGKIGLSVLK
jgi:hypothetical protein